MDAALRVAGLSKSYGGTAALRDFQMEVRAGEIHALLGQNGCGKSTVVKVLTGVVAPDAGAITLYGEALRLPVSSPERLGIAVVHQDVGLVDSMTVLENLGVTSRYGTGALRPIDDRRERRIYRDLMAQLDIALDLDTRVATLRPAERSLLGIVRAMRIAGARASRQLLILDEPTAALSSTESAKILRVMRSVAALGSAVVFISHRLGEVMAACDRATVMRAGRDVAALQVAQTTRTELVTLMLGKQLGDFYPSPPDFDASKASRLVLNRLSGRRIRDLDLQLHAGEIVGLAGLAGMGQEELPELLSGAAPVMAGSCLIDGVPVAFDSPRAALRAGIALVPGNRIRDGLWIAGTAEENLTLPVLGQHATWRGIASRPLRESAQRSLEHVAVHPHRPDYPMTAFSGGNQQKIVLAKWLQVHPRVLLLDEPTQGVDPGSAKQILAYVMQAALRGAAVLVVSGDFEQLAAICHRVIVIQHGTHIAEVTRAQLSEAAILHALEVPVQAGSPPEAVDETSSKWGAR